MNPGQELFGALLVALRKAYPGMVYDSFLPPEETPYPFIYLNGTYEIEDFRMKGVYFGQTAISIDVWHNDPTQRGTVDSLLFSVRQIARALDRTDNYNWCLSACTLEYMPDYTTSQPLYKGILSLEFKHYRRRNNEQL
ncbi:MAG: hypothetical protein ACLUYS_09415 [Allobaculum sp.]|uniref:hypothetical protein n=1 Tax=Allobaculum sp. TaxID=1872463 RepID=UPI00399A8145